MPGVSANGKKADPFARPAEGMRINRLHKGRPIAGFSCLVLERKGGFREKAVRFSGPPRLSGEGSGRGNGMFPATCRRDRLRTERDVPGKTGKSGFGPGSKPRPDKGFRA